MLKERILAESESIQHERAESAERKWPLESDSTSDAQWAQWSAVRTFQALCLDCSTTTQGEVALSKRLNFSGPVGAGFFDLKPVGNRRRLQALLIQ